MTQLLEINSSLFDDHGQSSQRNLKLKPGVS